MGKRIVIALGGNALGNNLPEQMIAVKNTAKAIVDLIEEGHEVVVAHGNGPQVGMKRANWTARPLQPKSGKSVTGMVLTLTPTRRFTTCDPAIYAFWKRRPFPSL